MDMNSPFFKFDYFNFDISLIIAFIIGIAFGFALERGGFGNARILAAQFYFSNMRVLKVMFTAILTAMLGIYFLSVIGFMDLSLVYVSETYILPQVLGGLILGFGFIIGGYCPGTSLVSAATGRLDGFMFVFGVIAGIFVFGEMFPLVENFYYSTNMGSLTLPQYFNLPYGLVVFFVVVMALGAFVAAEWAEKKFADKNPENSL
jgi:uncharacterized membrane protein YedE/YeeE